MAKEEIRKVTCVPDMEDEAYQIYSALGYQLVSSNEIYNKNTFDSTSFLDSYAGFKSQTTETVHYISMVWKREPEKIANYDYLVDLEKRFDSLIAPVKPKEPFGVIEIALGLICCTVPGIILSLLNVGRKNAMVEWEKDFDEYWQTRQNLIAEIVRTSN